MLRSELEKLLVDYQPVNTDEISRSLNRFARSVLNVGNRTNSGGESFETIINTLGCDAAILITPDSTRAEPLRILLEVGVFRREDHYDWGVIAQVFAQTFYLLTDKDQIEKSHGSITGTFEHQMGLSLPLCNFANALTMDDGVESNRKDYEISDSTGKVVVDFALFSTME